MSFKPQPILNSALISQIQLQNVLLILFTPIIHSGFIECILSDTAYSIHAFIPENLFPEMVSVNNVLVSGYFIFVDGFAFIVDEIMVLGGYAANCIPMNVNLSSENRVLKEKLKTIWPSNAYFRDICMRNKLLVTNKNINRTKTSVTEVKTTFFIERVIFLLTRKSQCYKIGKFYLWSQEIQANCKVESNVAKKCFFCFPDLFITSSNSINCLSNELIEYKKLIEDNEEKNCKDSDFLDGHIEIEYFQYSDTQIIKQTKKIELIDITKFNRKN